MGNRRWWVLREAQGRTGMLGRCASRARCRMGGQHPQRLLRGPAAPRCSPRCGAAPRALTRATPFFLPPAPGLGLLACLAFCCAISSSRLSAIFFSMSASDMADCSAGSGQHRVVGAGPQGPQASSRGAWASGRMAAAAAAAAGQPEGVGARRAARQTRDLPPDHEWRAYQAGKTWRCGAGALGRLVSGAPLLRAALRRDSRSGVRCGRAAGQEGCVAGEGSRAARYSIAALRRLPVLTAAQADTASSHPEAAVMLPGARRGMGGSAAATRCGQQRPSLFSLAIALVLALASPARKTTHMGSASLSLSASHPCGSGTSLGTGRHGLPQTLLKALND